VAYLGLIIYGAADESQVEAAAEPETRRKEDINSAAKFDDASISVRHSHDSIPSKKPGLLF